MKRRKFWDRFYHRLFAFAAGLCVLVLLGIFGMLLLNGFRFFESVSLWSFLGSSNWNPSAWGKATYGIGAMLWSTLLVSLGAMVLAVPLGIGTAAYLSEVAPGRVRDWIKPAIELLAAVPSVVVGFIGIVVIAPIISRIFGLSNGLNALNGSILLAVMALPTIISVAEEAIRSVPNTYKEGAYALGANSWATLITVTLPACTSGLIAATMLGMGRVIGETMTVLMATGNANAMPHGFFDPVRTITATVAIEMGEVPYGTTHFYGLYALGAILFIITLIINLLAEGIAAKFRKQGR